MKMKKLLWGLSFVGCLFVLNKTEVVAEASPEINSIYSYYEGTDQARRWSDVKYAYTNDFEMAGAIVELFNKSPYPYKELNEDFGTFDREVISNLTFFEAEAELRNLSILQYAENLEGADITGTIKDFRPLLNAHHMKELEINSPDIDLNSLHNMKELEYLNIWQGEMNKGEGKINTTITDLTPLNNNNNLKTISIDSYDIEFPKVTLKKSMRKYVLVNPFILSKQFDGCNKEVTSDISNFNFSDDILTWDNITPAVKELPISWKFEKGNFVYKGESSIPIYWID